MATIKEITVPDIGNFKEVEIIEMAIKPGMTVQVEDALITLETEKSTMDVPAPLAGKIQEVKVKLGDKVSQGDVIALIALENDVPEESTTSKDNATTHETEASGTEIITVVVPDTGSDKPVEIIEVAVKVNDEIQAESTLITLESEKASMDIPSPQTGQVAEVLVKVGDKVSTGTAIVKLKIQGKSVTAVAPSTSEGKPAVATPQRAAPAVLARAPDHSQVHAGPATRRLATELGVDLTKVSGTGLKNRIITADVKAFVKSVMQGGSGGFNIEKAPEIDFSQFGAIEVKPLSRIKKWTGKNLHRNWITIPHITQFDEADITELELFRQENKKQADEQGVKLTPLTFVIKAVLSALQTYPQFNASLAANGTDVVFKNYFHIGIAVDTPNGLMVPVIRDVDTKSIFELAREIGELGSKAKDGKLKNDQMQGSCFTISSLGSIGGTAFTPIINAPDLAILGLSKAQIKPVFVANEFVPRKILPLSLSYDHRVIDGVEGAKFAAHIAAQLQDIRKLLL